MDNKKYKPSQEELDYMRLHYWEVWQGLPNLQFEPATSEKGEALRYSKEGNYIWVPKTALNAYRSNPETIYLVMMHKNPAERIRAIWLEPKTDSLEEIISLARRLNQREILEKVEILAKRLDREEEILYEVMSLARRLNQREIDETLERKNG